MGPWRDALAALDDAGFEGIEERDLSAEAIPSAEEIRRMYLAISFLNPRLGEINPASFQEFMDASVRYASGQSQGVFIYRFISGTRPIG